MARPLEPGLDWSLTTVTVAAIVSLVGFLFALALDEFGFWPAIPYAHFVFGGLAGATAVHRMHPARPIVVLFVFATVMSILLVVGRVLFGWYVLGESV
jgi:hypothetical protein